MDTVFSGLHVWVAALLDQWYFRAGEQLELIMWSCTAHWLLIASWLNQFTSSPPLLNSPVDFWFEDALGHLTACMVNSRVEQPQDMLVAIFVTKREAETHLGNNQPTTKTHKTNKTKQKQPKASKQKHTQNPQTTKIKNEEENKTQHSI